MNVSDSSARGVAIIVVTGVLLGAGFNYLGQMSRPARGLTWIAVPKELPSLEDHMQLSGEQSGSTTPGSVETPSEPPAVTSPQPANGAPPSAASATKTASVPKAETREKTVDTAKTEPKPATTKSSTAPAASAPATSMADPDDPLGGAVAAAGGEGVPDIPDLDRPFAVQLPTVKRFFDARAAYIIDARDPEEYAEGHIPGAVNLPFSTAGTDPEKLQAVDPGERPIIVYCGGGTCEVSMSLAETLVYQYAKRKVLVYMGGFPEWQAAGYPVQKGKEGAQG